MGHMVVGPGGLIIPEEAATPATPAAGTARIWAGPAGQIHFQNDAGVDVEPYSDVNPPNTLNLSDQATAPSNPPAGQSTLYTPDGKSLRLRDTDGTEVTIGPSAGGSSPVLSSLWTNREFNIAGTATRTYATANIQHFTPLIIGAACTVTGLRYRKGSGTTAHNVILSLYNAAGTQVATTGSTAAGTSANQIIDKNLTATYSAAAGLYWVCLTGSLTTGDFYGCATNEFFAPAWTAASGTLTTPATITPPAITAQPTAALIPMISTY